ncbi:hypothetical protein ABPG75_004720 [Micractinium tetrahymenae]
MADLSDCPPAPAGTVDPPPGSYMTWQLPISGTRNFTCIGGKVVGDGAVLTYSGNDTGKGYYLPPTPGEMIGRVGYAVADLQKAGFYLFDTAKNTTVPVPTKLPDARWPIAQARAPARRQLLRLSPEATDCDYVTRTNTTGGATPTDCGNTPEGGELLIPFTATITCWSCK